MKTYNQIHFSQISEILMQAALGVSAVCGQRLVTSDMILSLSDLHYKSWTGIKEPYYIAIREMGTESGFKEHCIKRCKGLGYPLVMYYEEWNGKKFPVREVMFEVCDGMETVVEVAGIELWDAIEEDYNNGNSDAHALDNSIYFYCDYGFIASDPTDKEIIEYLIKHGC